MIDPSFRSTHSVTVRGVSPVAGMDPLAYADFDGNGAFTAVEGSRDETLFLRSPDGGGSAIGYTELRQAVEKAGGTIGTEALAQALEARERHAWVGFSGLPPGVSHPIVDYTFRLGTDGEVHADYTVAKSARVIAPHDGNIAGLDLNGDGVSDPANDALVQIERYDDGVTYQHFCKAEDLTEAVRAAGGRVDQGNMDSALRGLFNNEPGPISLAEFGRQVDGCSPFVHRALRVDDQGLVMDFEVNRDV